MCWPVHSAVGHPSFHSLALSRRPTIPAALPLPTLFHQTFVLQLIRIVAVRTESPVVLEGAIAYRACIFEHEAAGRTRQVGLIDGRAAPNADGRVRATRGISRVVSDGPQRSACQSRISIKSNIDILMDRRKISSSRRGSHQPGRGDSGCAYRATQVAASQDPGFINIEGSVARSPLRHGICRRAPIHFVRVHNAGCRYYEEVSGLPSTTQYRVDKCRDRVGELLEGAEFATVVIVRVNYSTGFKACLRGRDGS